MVRIFFVLLFFPLMASAYNFDTLKEKLIVRYGEKAVKKAIASKIFFVETRNYNNKEIRQIYIGIERRFPDLLIEHYHFYFSHFFENGCEIKDRILDLYRRSCNIDTPTSRAHFLFHLVRLSTFFEEIPSLKKTLYFQKQLDLLALALKYIEKKAPLSSYPNLASKSNVILFDDEGVFKISSGRDCEAMNVDLSFLLGLDHVFLPTISYWIQNQRGVLQLFLPNTERISLGLKKIDSLSLVPSYYVGCALSILLFSISDLHARNFYWVPSASGAYEVGLWDIEFSYEMNRFAPKEIRDIKSMSIPYSWVGWDHPLYNLQGDFTHCILFDRFLFLWESRREEIEKVLTSPFCSTFLSQKSKEDFLRCLDTLIHVMKLGKDVSVQSLHLAVLPEYNRLEKMVHKLFPDYGPGEALFQLSGSPWGWMKRFNKEEQRRYMDWVKRFLHSLPRERKKNVEEKK